MLVPRFDANSLNWIFHIGEFLIDVPKMEIDDNIFGYLNILLLACCLLFADLLPGWCVIAICDATVSSVIVLSDG